MSSEQQSKLKADLFLHTKNTKSDVFSYYTWVYMNRSINRLYIRSAGISVCIADSIFLRLGVLGHLRYPESCGMLCLYDVFYKSPIHGLTVPKRKLNGANTASESRIPYKAFLDGSRYTTLRCVATKPPRIWRTRRQIENLAPPTVTTASALIFGDLTLLHGLTQFDCH